MTIVEQACEMRPGNPAFDSRRVLHLTVHKRMGMRASVFVLRQSFAGDGVVVAAAGSRVAVIFAAFPGDDVRMFYGSFAWMPFARTSPACTSLLGEVLILLQQTADGARVSLAHLATNQLALGMGADGIALKMRRFACGQASDFGSHLYDGHALVDLYDVTCARCDMPCDGLLGTYCGPRSISCFIAASPPLGYETDDTAAQKRLFCTPFARLQGR